MESTRQRHGPPEQSPAEDSVLCLTIDGMDQAKFRLPRNLALTKQFDKAWRPQEHCVAVLAAGLVDCFYLLQPDCGADSSMTSSLLSHTLDIVQERLRERGRAMPLHLVIQVDNTARENRNQFVNKWAAWLMLRGLFRSVTFQFLPVGHTHINVDQKFSTIATKLAVQAVFETPED
jgi:hypothetical protein